jgi:Ser/Thr protein kinase RdoA (MazF antagonist)
MAYEPTPPGWRPHWNDPIMLDVTANLPPEETAVASRMHELQQYLQTLPKTPDSYGMIHFDPHGGNFFVADSGQITFFDFDDCAFGHFIYDVALTVFYGVIGQEDEVAWTDAFLTHFLRGYRHEKALADAWVAEIPHFLKLREIDLYAVIHRSFDVDNIDNPWVAGFMEGRRQRIEEGVPFLDFDFGNG